MRSLNQPLMDYSACFDFVALNWKSGTFDLAACENFWCGQADRGDEMLCRTTPGGRWVLVFVDFDEGPHPVSRELTSAQAATWLRVNKFAPPADLELASPHDVTEQWVGGSPGPPSRLDRDWAPPPGESPPLDADAVATPQEEKAPRNVCESGIPDRVTLDQAAAMVHRSKRTLERHKTDGKLPDPIVEGGGGKPDLWDWPTIRPWLMKEFNVMLPERYPDRRP